MDILQIEIIEPKVLPIFENLERMGLIKIAPNGRKRRCKTGETKISSVQISPSPLVVPITLAEEPNADFIKGFGIWKNTPISAAEIRKNAWSDRL